MSDIQENLRKALNRSKSYLLAAARGDKSLFLTYAKEKQDPSTEASAWTALALSTYEDEAALQAAFAIKQFLLDSQNQDGGWSTKPGAGRSDWTSAPALMSLRALDQIQTPSKNTAKQSINFAFEYLLDSRYFAKPATRLVTLVAKGSGALNKDRGWPWDPDCFHWIEPTAYALLAMNIPKRPERNKVAIEHALGKAEDFILDHACKGGGWNHGNDITLGAPLPAYRLTTAEALLALQARKKEAKVETGLEYLQSWASKDTSSLSLAMSILALSAYGRDCRQEVQFLMARQESDGNFTANITTTALSTLALAAHLQKKSPLFF